jgi:PadR family transcriptional regulator, regulatory protein PadR
MSSIGDLERCVLVAILHLRSNAYGVTIREEIGERLGRTPAFGAIYTALSRLEKKGLVVPREGEATSSRGGRRKRFYTVTGTGQSVLTSSLSDLDRMIDGLPNFGCST